MNTITIANCLKRAAELENVSDTARLDTELLLAEVLQKPRSYLFAWPEVVLSSEQKKCFNEYFSRRLLGEPVAHILGRREFWSLSLNVDASTLIPRPDTEILVETLLNIYKEDTPTTQRRLLDLGTGTGAIALALAKEKPQWQIEGVDKSAAAIQLAEKNKISLAVTNLEFYVSDWFAAVAERSPALFDVIVANPPYLAENDPHLMQGDLRFEPKSALVADEEGYADLFYIIRNAKSFLQEEGFLLLEHGFEQGERVRNCFMSCGYKDIHTLKDYHDNERIAFAKQISSKS